MNERNLKRLSYVGLGLQIIAGIILVGIVVTNNIFENHNIVPDFVVTLFYIGLATCLIASLLIRRLKNMKK